jgi:hypothetical protein
MDAARAGGHGERLEPEAAQEIADCASRRAHLGEALPGGVEVEDEPVRTLEAVGAASPHEGGDHALFREVDKRGRVVGGDVVDRPPSRLGTSTVAIQSRAQTEGRLGCPPEGRTHAVPGAAVRASGGSRRDREQPPFIRDPLEPLNATVAEPDP